MRIKCIHCMEPVDANAAVCPHCRNSPMGAMPGQEIGFSGKVQAIENLVKMVVGLAILIFIFYMLVKM